jgi:hypothetical protein
MVEWGRVWRVREETAETEVASWFGVRSGYPFLASTDALEKRTLRMLVRKKKKEKRQVRVENWDAYALH